MEKNGRCAIETMKSMMRRNGRRRCRGRGEGKGLVKEEGGEGGGEEKESGIDWDKYEHCETGPREG